MHCSHLIIPIALLAIGTAVGLWFYAMIRADYKIRQKYLAKLDLAQKHPYTLVRPCAGFELFLLDNLISVLHAKGNLPQQILLVVPHNDLSIEVVHAAQKILIHNNIQTKIIKTDIDNDTINHKAMQLHACTELCSSYPAVVYADSDVDLTDFCIDELLALCAKPNIASAWAPCVEVIPCQQLGERASQAVLAGSMHAFSLLANLDAGLFVGKLCAMQTHTIAQFGGWASLAHVLSEDTEIARRLKLQHANIVATSQVALARPCHRTWMATIHRYSRWLLSMRAQRPWHYLSYPWLFFCTPIWLTVLGFTACIDKSQQHAAFCISLSLLLSRLSLAAWARRCSGLPTSLKIACLDSLLSDITLAIAWVLSSYRRTVIWRGRRLRLVRPLRARFLGKSHV